MRILPFHCFCSTLFPLPASEPNIPKMRKEVCSLVAPAVMNTQRRVEQTVSLGETNLFKDKVKADSLLRSTRRNCLTSPVRRRGIENSPSFQIICSGLFIQPQTAGYKRREARTKNFHLLPEGSVGIREVTHFNGKW